MTIARRFNACHWAHRDTAPESPVSKSADDPKILSPAGFDACRFVPQSGDALRVLMQEETFLRRATENWIGLSALVFSLSWYLGRGPQAGIKAGLWP